MLMKDNSKIWLSPPHIEDDEKQSLNDLIDSNWVTTGGHATTAFEEDLKRYLEVDSPVVALNSGTSAIHLALLLAGVTRGDSVMCQTMSFVATANPILYIGANPIFIDSEIETWNMCPETLEDAIKKEIENDGRKPAAIIVVHSYGMPCKIGELSEISKKYNIPLIEDAAEALGSKYKDKKCGSFGDFATFSFNGNKIITTGTGGVLVIKNKKLEKKARHLANQAKTSSFDYNHDMLGFNYGMSGLSAAMGIAQLKGIEKKVNMRRANNWFYREVFDPVEEVFVLKEPIFNFFSNFWLTTILFDTKAEKKLNKEGLRKYLESANIESRLLWKPLHQQSFYSKYKYYGAGIADELYVNGLCLPSGSSLSMEQKKRIASVIKDYFKTDI